ncbi:MAG: putative methyltransferase [Acidimicrobiales bacterium]|nr:putative methyltransferase [Acidimicrobiales bacterium]
MTFHWGPVRKIFFDAPLAGHATDFWETEWVGEVREYEGALRTRLEAVLPGPVRVLESGCGQGAVAAALHHQGHTVVGVDLARQALRGCRARHPDLPLMVSDVGRLPFPDGSFDAVVSLGVIEHLETGPADLLAEQARVLAPGGVLVLTVPGRNWYRRWCDFSQLTLRRRRSYGQRGRLVTRRRELAVDVEPIGAFHQYEFSRRQVLHLCDQAGLVVESWEPFGAVWAFRDSPLLIRLTRRLGATNPFADPPARPQRPAAAPPASARGAALRAYLREPIIEGHGRDPLSRSMAWFTAHGFGHMQLVVARVRPGPS